ncbi:MAG: carbohydrate ABC transporter permease [Armatimonadota bacterium]
MNLILWIIAVAGIYFALGGWLFLIVDLIKRKAWQNISFIIIAPIVSYFITKYAIGKFTIPKESGMNFAFAISVFCYLLSLMISVLNFKTNKKISWLEKKDINETSRQVKIHLALTTGALIFFVPFYWLVTTSLKPDERTNVFPPDLIPLEQRKIIENGNEYNIFKIVNEDKSIIKVAKIDENDGETWVVRNLDNNEEFEIDKSKLQPDLHFVMIWDNYKDALQFLPPEYNKGIVPLWNTVYITILSIIGSVLASSMVAFAFARLRWPGRDILFVVMLATMMIPPAVTMLPVFLIFRSLNWIDTLKPLWVPAFFGSGFFVFLLRQFFMTIPNDLEEAAKIDGCSFWGIYWKIMLPLIKPALAAITIFAFMGSWNNFMGPLIYINSPEKMTLAYALQLFQGTYGGEPAMMMAAATLVMLPVLGVFFFTQRYMIQGVTLTGIKG